ncbi:MAG TPA: PAS domain-containing protein [Dongiaceae bacterium]|nr:PAS domain-containing protein [Dongiaceae bacterium]
MAEEDSFRLLAADEVANFKCRTRVLERLLAYWQSKRAGRPWPLRADIDPAEIKSLLSHIMLVDISRDPFRVRYRLVGTEIARVAHFDFTGHYLDQLAFESGDAMDWVGCYRQVVDAGLPGFGIVHWQTLNTAYRWIEFLICPLSADGSGVTQCIAAEDYQPLNPTEFDRIGHAAPQR